VRSVGAVRRKNFRTGSRVCLLARMVQVLEPPVGRSCHVMQNFLIRRGAPNPYSLFPSVRSSSSIVVTRIYAEV